MWHLELWWICQEPFNTSRFEMIVMVSFAQGMRLETRQPSKVDFDTTNSLQFAKVKNYLTETWKVNFISGNVFRGFQSMMAKNMANKLSILL